ncbi:N-acetylglucosamine kinase [Paraclostridium tenue]|uniref:BadF/BadG/BcrA/BcrD ATPase family protein n=1 Tax=Paraclostridium tenue TaxID=1737 RepID=A0ABN1LYB9_9FIRM
MYYIGVDGGGTKTTFTIIDKKGYKIAKYQAKTTHYEQIGFNGVEDVLNEGFNKTLEISNVSKDDIKSVFLGLPGYGEVKSVVTNIDNIVKKILKNIKFKVGNDVEVGLAGSLAGKEGINIVSGTGSIALGKDSKGKTIRCGGWGDYIGDEGSAYWIGKKTIEMFSKEADKRIERGLIYKNIKEKLNINDDFDIIDYVLNDIKKDRTQIAQFSKLCFESAILNDKNALSIFNEAGYELSLLVKMIINELEFDGDILVSYSGGVFKSGDLILSPLKKYLNEYSVKFIKPILGPDMGACLLAYKLSNENIGEDIINNMVNNLEYDFI